jgi:hypothetical protein
MFRAPLAIFRPFLEHGHGKPLNEVRMLCNGTLVPLASGNRSALYAS